MKMGIDAGRDATSIKTSANDRKRAGWYEWIEKWVNTVTRPGSFMGACQPLRADRDVRKRQYA